MSMRATRRRVRRCLPGGGGFLLVLAGFLLIGACSAVQVTPHAAGDPAPTSGEVDVQYAARCLACTATYTTPTDTETVEVEGSWSRTISSGGRRQVTLTVAAVGRETHLEGKIWVGGRRVARDRVESASSGRNSIQLVASVPSGGGGG